MPSTPCSYRKPCPPLSSEEAVGKQPVACCTCGGSSSSAAFCSPQRCLLLLTALPCFPFQPPGSRGTQNPSRERQRPRRGSGTAALGAGGWRAAPGGSVRAVPAQLCHHWGEDAPAGGGATARLCRGRHQAASAAHSCAFRKGLLCLILPKHSAL